MATPALADVVTTLLAGKQRFLDLIDQLEAISPDVLKGDEEALKAAIAALPAIDSASLSSSLVAGLAVIKAGRGISGGGYDASLA